MNPITIIGKNSYLARHFLAATENTDVVALSHDAIGDIALYQTECIVNFAYPSAYMTAPYDPANDLDRTLVNRIKDTDIHFVTFSSRKVYDLSYPSPWNENTPLAGQSEYGRNKVITEQYVREYMGERHTILRLGNIIEQQPGRHTFLGIALRSLKQNRRIELNIDPATKRDFLPLENFVTALGKIIQRRPSGTYNLGSGIETAVGDIAAWIIEGFGQGEITSSQDSQEDAFVLDVSRMESMIGPFCHRNDIREACIESGRRVLNG